MYLRVTLNGRRSSVTIAEEYEFLIAQGWKPRLVSATKRREARSLSTAGPEGEVAGIAGSQGRHSAKTRNLAGNLGLSIYMSHPTGDALAACSGMSIATPLGRSSMAEQGPVRATAAAKALLRLYLAQVQTPLTDGNTESSQSV